MTTPSGVMVTVEYGWIQLVRAEKVENGRLYLGGYSIRYDRQNKEVSRTPVTWNCSLGFQDS
jgi:hypothetical protein